MLCVGKTLFYVILSVLVMIGTTLAQTEGEKNALKQLGKGFMIYQTISSPAKVMKYDLDGTGNVNTREIHAVASDEYHFSLTNDGAAVYYRKVSGTSGDIWAMNPDGTNKRKITKQAYPYISVVRTPASGNRYSFTSSSTSDKPADLAWWPTYAMYIGNMDGTVEKVVDKGSTMVDHTAFEKNRIAFRLGGSDIYVMDIGSTTQTKIVQGCAPAFWKNPDSLLVNRISHKGFTVYKKAGSSWSMSISTGDVYPNKRTMYRWTNKIDWVTVQDNNEGPKVCWAINVYDAKNKQVKITFEPSMVVGLYLDSQVSAAYTAKSKLVNSNLNNKYAIGYFDIRGRRIFSPVSKDISSSALVLKMQVESVQKVILRF